MIAASMLARLIQGADRRPLIRFQDGHIGIPINLRVSSRGRFLALLGRLVEIRGQYSDRHYSIHIPGMSDDV